MFTSPKRNLYGVLVFVGNAEIVDEDESEDIWTKQKQENVKWS